MSGSDTQRLAEAIMKSKRVDEAFERIIEETCRAILKPGDRTIDGGANVGRHAVVMAQAVGPAGRVLAFEPIPEVAGKLRKRLQEANANNVQIVEAALSNAPGKATFNVVTNDPAYSGLQKRSYPFEAQISEIDVELVTMDDYAAQLDRLMMIKLDLEGGEFRALQGARKLMETRRPLITFENGRAVPAATYGYSEAEFFGFFEHAGYRLTDIFGRPFGASEWSVERYPWNFFAEPKEAALLERLLPDILRKCLPAA